MRSCAAAALLACWSIVPVGCDKPPSGGDAPTEVKGEPTAAADAKAPAPTPASDASAAKAEPAAEPPAMTNTGILSEQEFAALHELTKADAPPLHGQEITLPGGSRAYLSLPSGATAPLPGVIVIHEWWGLNDHIRHWADRLAADGYAALAVDLYGGKVATQPDQAMEMMKKVDDAKARAILAEAHRFLAEDARVQAERRGVIGWCFGGGWSLRHALAQPDLDAAIVYYGRLETDPKVLETIEAPVMGVFGDQDEGIPPQSVEAFAAAMKEAGQPLELHRYDAPHAFANPSSAHYDAKAAEDAWGHARAFLSKHLRG